MNHKNFSIKEALKFGFNKYIDNFGKFLNLILLTFLTFAILFLFTGGISVILYQMFYRFIQTNIIQKIFSGILFFLPILISSALTTYIFYYELIRISLNLYDGKVFDKYKIIEIPKLKLIKLIIANCWFGIRILLGLLFFIFPGLYLFSKYYFTGFSIVEKDNTIKDDIDYNKKLSEDVKLKVLGFGILIIVLETLFNVGIITIIFSPILILANVYVYKKLSEQIQAG